LQELRPTPIGGSDADIVVARVAVCWR